MKRYWILTLIGLVLCLGVAWAMKSMPRLLSEEECSPLYRQYAHVPGIKASYVKGFRVNDTLAIDATLLRATDSAGWARLQEDFILQPLPPSVMAKIEQGKDLVSIKKISETEVAAFSLLKRSVSIFHTKYRDERYAVYYHNFDNNVSKTFK